MQRIERSHRALEWPTMSLLTCVYSAYFALVFFLGGFSLFLIVPAMAIILTFHSSLQHEALHILEPRWPLFGKAIAYLPLGLAIPYPRFRDLHLKHHKNENLTDPIDDPESFYMVPEYWDQASKVKKAVLTLNNTLLGRMVLGPAIGQYFFMRADWQEIKEGQKGILIAWLVHFALSGLIVALILTQSSFPIIVYFIACYIALSILKIRTFLEHRAEEQVNGRSVIIEDRGPLAILFLNNNYHAAHHAHPNVPWYNLPKLFRTHRDKFLSQNRGYYYRNYLAVFRSHFFWTKEKVPHPLWSLENRSDR